MPYWPQQIHMATPKCTGGKKKILSTSCLYSAGLGMEKKVGNGYQASCISLFTLLFLAQTLKRFLDEEIK